MAEHEIISVADEGRFFAYVIRFCERSPVCDGLPRDVNEQFDLIRGIVDC